MNYISKNNLYEEIRQILDQSRNKAYRAVNNTMVEAYWLIGHKIVEAQDGEESAQYGKAIIKELSADLTTEYGKGFDETNLRRMRKFYLLFKNRDTLCHDLTWSHYRALLKVENETAREFYIEESVKSDWSVRELTRQINSFTSNDSYQVKIKQV